MAKLRDAVRVDHTEKSFERCRFTHDWNEGDHPYILGTGTTGTRYFVITLPGQIQAQVALKAAPPQVDTSVVGQQYKEGAAIHRTLHLEDDVHVKIVRQLYVRRSHILDLPVSDCASNCGVPHQRSMESNTSDARLVIRA